MNWGHIGTTNHVMLPDGSAACNDRLMLREGRGKGKETDCPKCLERIQQRKVEPYRRWFWDGSVVHCAQGRGNHAVCRAEILPHWRLVDRPRGDKKPRCNGCEAKLEIWRQRAADRRMELAAASRKHNERKVRRPCLRCGKMAWSTKNHRICSECTKMNADKWDIGEGIEVRL